MNAIKKKWGWNWDEEDRGVTLFADGAQVATLATQHPSRDGLRLVDLATAHQPDRVQISDHGMGNMSVQMFDAAGLLLCDENF